MYMLVDFCNCTRSLLVSRSFFDVVFSSVSRSARAVLIRYCLDWDRRRPRTAAMSRHSMPLRECIRHPRHCHMPSRHSGRLLYRGRRPEPGCMPAPFACPRLGDGSLTCSQISCVTTSMVRMRIVRGSGNVNLVRDRRNAAAKYQSALSASS